MSNENVQAEAAYQVVVNEEEQYSIWPAAKELPAGWIATGPGGSREVCLQYIQEVWVDMRPLSLRKPAQTGAA